MAFTGRLQVQLLKQDTYIPIENAKVTVISRSEPTRQMEKTTITDTSGKTDELELDAPPIDLSMTPSGKLPYSLYDIKIEASGYQPLIIKGTQIYPERLAIQQNNMIPIGARQEQRIIDIPPNVQVGNFPPKIPENPDKPLPPPPSGLVVLPEPVVPEFVVVHAGSPNDDSAPNYTVKYRDYIKNVASSEIFSTWSENTIRANAYCIISFTLNRIYTEWYRGKGKNFDVTTSTAFDQAFSYGRNVYDNISKVVDDIFTTYIKREGRKQPYLAQYCDGVNVQCPGWLTQWGSKYLGDQGKTPYEILTNFYGSDIGLVTAKKVKGIPRSYPGYPLQLGSAGDPVRQIQTYLNRISQDYPLIPKLKVDGVFGQSTKESVMVFQKVFYLPVTGIVDYATWYKISDIYVGVTKIAESRSEEIYVEDKGMGIFTPPIMPLDDREIPRIKYPLY